MLVLAVVVIVLFVLGVGVDGGVSGARSTAWSKQDENLVKRAERPEHAALPLAVVHHLHRVRAHSPRPAAAPRQQAVGAEGDASQQRSFVKLAFAFGITLGMLGFAGLLARGVLQDALPCWRRATNPNASRCRCCSSSCFPVWLAALIGVGILAAIMSTADGLGGVLVADHRQRHLPPFARASCSTPNKTERGRAATAIELLISRVGHRAGHLGDLHGASRGLFMDTQHRASPCGSASAA